MNNRRSFLKTLLAGTAAFAVLPSASTYARKWVVPKGEQLWRVNPEWLNATYEIKFIWAPGQIDLVTNPPMPMIYDRTTIPPPNVVMEDCPVRYRTLEDVNAGKYIPMMVEYT